jgi:RNA polymerase sigma-70 factor (ECF subfamily)
MARVDIAPYDPEIPVIEAVQQRDPDALAELMRRHGRWVRGVIFGVLGTADEVDDVAQKVWFKLWREADQLEDPSRWRAWLYRIARNAATDAGRRQQFNKRLKERLEKQVTPPAASVSDPSHSLIADEGHQRMLEAIASLEPLYREPFVLRHLEDWSYQEIGDVLGLPVETVETRLTRARRKLREKLKTQE